MSHAAPHFRCFAAPREPFSPIGEAVLFVLKRARGFVKSRGMTVGDVRRMIRREIDIHVPEDIVREGLAEITDHGYARKTDAYRWKFDRCPKHRDQLRNHVPDRHESIRP